MAAGTVSYEQPSYGSLAGAMGDKIGSAISMAASARKRREDEIKELNEKPNKTDEEELRLSDLLQEKTDRKPGSLFGKAMVSEFGGDKARRTMGFFQSNPDDKNDPALTKAQRFEASLQAPPKQGVIQPELPLSDAGYKEQSTVDKLAGVIAIKFKEISSKLDGLKNQEAADQTPSVVVKLADNINGLKSYFNKNNKIQEESNTISNEQLTENIKAADRAEASDIEDSGESRDRQVGGVGYDNERERGEGAKGIIGKVLDVGKGLIGGRRGGRRGKNRMPRMSKGRQYTKPIGPLGRGSSQPWARGRGQSGGMGGFMPRLQSRALPGRKFASGGVIDRPGDQVKLASGGVVDNPTNLSGGGDQAIIPKAKLTDAIKTNPENQKKSGPFAKALMLPTVAAGSLVLSTLTNVVKNMGGLSKIFMPILGKILGPAATAFGLPGGLVAGMLLGGSPAQAHPGPEPHGKKGTPEKSVTSANKTPGSPGFMMPQMSTGGKSVDGFGVTSGFGPRSSPGGVGSTNHLGVDYGTPQGTQLSTKKAGRVQKVTVPAQGNNGEVHVIHDDGTEARYLHLSKTSVSQGAQVVAGQVLGATGGQVGTPGAGPSTGPHLHFEYYPSAGSGPVDGSGVASQIFSVGGTVAPGPTSAVAPPTTSPDAAAPAAAAPATQTPVLIGPPAPAPPVIGPPAPGVQDNSDSSWSIENPESPNDPAPPEF